MKKILLVTIVFLFFTRVVFPQTNPVQQKAIVLKRMVELRHYSPRVVDDSFSVTVFTSLLNAADPRRLLFTADEYQQLLGFKIKIDDELRGQGWGFFDKFITFYKRALNRADSIINVLSQKPFDFTANESIGMGRRSDNFNFAADNAALSNRWSRYFKYQALTRTYDVLHADSSAKRSFVSMLASQETSLREKIKKAELKFIKRILDHPAGYSTIATELYLDAIATSFDPHSNYFSPAGKEKFQSELSTEGYFFGILFEENEKGEVVIKQLTPGGPAWKSGELNKGDILLSLLWEGKEAQDMTGASVEEVVEVLDQSNHDKLLFRLRKTDGTISNAILRKEKLDNDENIVRSFVLKGEKNIGYILLPGFYTEWENETGSSCANDVAKEIIKLKKENIEGLVLDVRYNGGGSLGEALDMIGIFIDEGPLAAVKSKDGKLITLKDPNRGTIYDGPLLLMINGQSASASEMLAASLQDYNRAVIAGSRTYGKATMQELFLMDTTSTRQVSGASGKDMVKITTGKLFRLNGRTAQLSGVIPDVEIPDAFDGLEIGERFEEYPLAADTVKKNNYYKPLPYLPVSELARRSTARILVTPAFLVIKKIIEEEQKALQATSRVIPLKPESFEKWALAQELNLEMMKGESKAPGKFTIENHAQDKQLLQNDPYAKEMNERWLQKLASDIYIQETFLVLTDLINLQKAAPKN